MNKHLRKVILHRMIDDDLTRQDLAKICEIKDSYMRNILTNQAPISRKVLKKLNEFLGSEYTQEQANK